jgi:hypothetical protein
VELPILEIRIGTGTSIRLEVSFPGGIDSMINSGEFILNNVEIDVATG